MVDSITTRTLDYFALLVGASIVALCSGVLATLCVKYELRGFAWGFAATFRILLGEVAVTIGVSICPAPHGRY